MSISSRFLWMAEILELNPDDRILEIGCGAGVAVEQIAMRLKGGSITAIDRSKPMISKAMIRNERFIQEKKAEFILTELAQLPEGTRRYDKIFAFNVNLFWTKKYFSNETQIIKSHLGGKGRLYLFYQPPDASDAKRISNLVSKNLASHGFEVVETVYDKTVHSCCIVSRPSVK